MPPLLLLLPLLLLMLLLLSGVCPRLLPSILTWVTGVP
jgi:hypothetical protein